MPRLHAHTFSGTRWTCAKFASFATVGMLPWVSSERSEANKQAKKIHYNEEKTTHCALGIWKAPQEWSARSCDGADDGDDDGDGATIRTTAVMPSTRLYIHYSHTFWRWAFRARPRLVCAPGSWFVCSLIHFVPSFSLTLFAIPRLVFYQTVWEEFWLWQKGLWRVFHYLRNGTLPTVATTTTTICTPPSCCVG